MLFFLVSCCSFLSVVFLSCQLFFFLVSCCSFLSVVVLSCQLFFNVSSCSLFSCWLFVCCYKEPPSDPQLAYCGQDFIVGGNPPCVCRVTSLGSPAGRLVWRSGDAALLSGDYGVTQLRFPYEKMDRTRTGEAVKCQVDWVVSRNSTSFRTACTFNFNS